jgi:hypothetical protein
VVRDLLTPDEAGGLGATAGTVTLTRRTVTPASDSWEAPTVTISTETLLAQVFGVSEELVGLPAQEPDNGVVTSTDLMCICALPAGGYAAGDVLSVNGKPVTVVLVRTIPAAGTPVALKMVVR